jgi:hypothetical protein
MGCLPLSDQSIADALAGKGLGWSVLHACYMYQPKVISCRPDSDVVGKIPPLVNKGLENDQFVDDLLYIHTYDKRWFSDFPMANGGFP